MSRGKCPHRYYQKETVSKVTEEELPFTSTGSVP
jgi:hypothetical protein